MVQTRGQQVRDHNTPQQGGPTPSKQTECGFAADDVGGPIFTTDKENMITKDIRTSGHNKGPLPLTSSIKDNARTCQGPVVTSQSVQTTDKNIDKQRYCDSKITAPVVSQTQLTPHGQQGMGSRLSCADAGGRAILSQDNDYDGLTPYQGAPTDEDIYYDTRPSAFPVGLMPRTSYGSSGCYQGEAAVAEKNDRHTSNNQSQPGANLVGRISSLVASNPDRGKMTQNDTSPTFGIYFGPSSPTSRSPSTSKSIAFFNPSSSAHLVNPQFHQCSPKLFAGTSPTPIQPSLSVGGQTVLIVADARPRESGSMHTGTVPTTLRDKRLAEYEPRLNRQSNKGAGVSKQVNKADGTTIIGGPDADYSYDTRRSVSAQPMIRDGRTRATVLDQDDGSWARHQLHVKQLTNNVNQHFEKERDQEKGPAQTGPYVSAPVGAHERLEYPAQTIYDARMAEDSADDECQPGFPVRQWLHPIPTLRGERMSHRDRYEGLGQRNPEFLPQPAGNCAPLEPVNKVMPNLSIPVARLAKMDVFEGEGNDQLDTFFDQVEEFAAFFYWDERETCRQARAHLRGTALAYVKRAPFQPRSWEELKALLLRRFQPRDLTATYKAQFRSRRRQKTEDIYAFVEALQKLADMAWPFMDHCAREELIVDQFLMGMDNHELNVQVAAHGHRRVDDILRVARSLEAVREEEKQYSQGQKPTLQARFVTKEQSRSPDTGILVKEVLARLGRDTGERWDTRSQPPTPGPQRVRSTERKDTKVTSRSPSRDYKRDRLTFIDRRSRSREGPAQCHRCTGYGHSAGECPSDGQYQMGPNGLPVRVRDPSMDSSQESRLTKDTTPPSKTLN